MTIKTNSINEQTELPFEKWTLQIPATGYCRGCPLMDLADKRVSECEKAFDEEWEQSLQFLKAVFQMEWDPLTDEFISDYDLQEGCIGPVIEAPNAPAALKQAMVGHVSVAWLMGHDIEDPTLQHYEPTRLALLDTKVTCNGCHLVGALKKFEGSFHHLFKSDFSYWGHRIEHVHSDFGHKGTLLYPTLDQPGENWWTYGGFLRNIRRLRIILNSEEDWGWAAHKGHT